MTYDLYIGDHTFSSWSLRGWLMFERFSIPVQTHMVGLYEGTLQQDLAKLGPARLVPVMRCPDGTVVGDTLAMAETLAERHPQAGLWPANPAARALARWMVAEMHSGFTALRTDCRGAYRGLWSVGGGRGRSLCRPAPGRPGLPPLARPWPAQTL